MRRGFGSETRNILDAASTVSSPSSPRESPLSLPIGRREALQTLPTQQHCLRGRAVRALSDTEAVSMPLAATGILIGLSANCVCLWSVDVVAGSKIVSFRPEAAHETACEEADKRSAWDSLFAAFDASQSGGRCEFRISSRCIQLSLRLARRTAKTTQGKGHGRPRLVPNFR